MRTLTFLILSGFALLALDTALSMGDCRMGITQACEYLKIYKINTDHLTGDIKQNTGDLDNV